LISVSPDAGNRAPRKRSGAAQSPATVSFSDIGLLECPTLRLLGDAPMPSCQPWGTVAPKQVPQLNGPGGS